MEKKWRTEHNDPEDSENPTRCILLENPFFFFSVSLLQRKWKSRFSFSKVTSCTNTKDIVESWLYTRTEISQKQSFLIIVNVFFLWMLSEEVNKQQIQIKIVSRLSSDLVICNRPPPDSNLSMQNEQEICFKWLSGCLCRGLQLELYKRHKISLDSLTYH